MFRPVLTGILLLCCGEALAAENTGWFAISNRTGKCIKQQGPAEIISIQRKLRSPYTVVDEKVENGKPVIVKVVCPSDNIEYEFFRTKALCDVELSKARAKDTAELNRYK